jgi:hypothetical protein
MKTEWLQAPNFCTFSVTSHHLPKSTCVKPSRSKVSSYAGLQAAAAAVGNLKKQKGFFFVIFEKFYKEAEMKN